jgi:hypothetical protein
MQTVTHNQTLSTILYATSLPPFTASIMPLESEMSPPVRWPPSYYLSPPNPKTGGRAPLVTFSPTPSLLPFTHLKKGPRAVVIHLSNRVVFVLYSAHDLLDPAPLIRRDNLSLTTASTTFRL